MAWHAAVAGACLVLGAVDVVWLGSAAEEAFATPTPTPTPDPIASPDPIPSPDPIRSPDPISSPAPTPSAPSPIAFTIHFGRNEDAIGAVERAALDELAPDLTGAVLIEGHADERGTEAYNLDLSRRRAERVAEYLAARGVQNLTIRALGESQPLGDDLLDRRVEIHQEEAP